MSLKEIFILRHGESEEDVDPNLNGEVSDEMISITKKGEEQITTVASILLGNVATSKGVRIIASPSNRAVQTANLLMGKFVDFNHSDFSIEPSIRNLYWGNATNRHNIKQIQQERYKAGVLYYQFPGGDHSPTFVNNIQKFTNKCLKEGSYNAHSESLIIVTHGFALRIIVKCLTKMSNAKFKWLANPPNCFVARLSVQNGIRLNTEMPIRQRK